jgi:hypothetical protein
MGLMTGNSNSVIYIDYTSEFKRNLRALAKKYRHIRSDIQPLINQLQTGALIGNQVKGSTYTLFKSRARNTPLQNLPILIPIKYLSAFNPPADDVVQDSRSV